MSVLSNSAHRYAAFISYPREPHETNCAQWLQEKLEEYKTPEDLIEAGYSSSIGRIFVDDTELGATGSLSDTIRQALVDSAWIIVICSPAAAQRRWVNDEIRYFVALGRKDRIIPILVDGDKDVSLPISITEIPVETAQDEDNLPLILDLRVLDGVASRRTVVRIVSTFLGCTFDQLWRRHEERRSRRLRKMLAAGAFAALIVLAITFYALLQRERRGVAETRQQLAESERKRTAESEKISRAIAHFSRGAEAEANRDLDTARLQYAAAVSVVDRPEFRRKLGDVWNAPEVLWETSLTGDSQAAGSWAVCFSGNGTELWVSSGSKEIKLFDVASGKPTHSIVMEHPVTALVGDPHSEWVAAGLDEGTIIVISPQLKALKTFHLESAISALAVDSDARFLAVGIRGHGMVALDLGSGIERWRAPSDQQDPTVYSIAFAKQGAHGILGMGRYVYWFDVDESKFGLLTALDDIVTSTAWSNVGDLAAAGGLDGPIYVNGSLVSNRSGVAKQILSARKRELPEFWDIRGHRGGTSTISFFQNGDRLASGGYDGVVRVWNSKTGDLLLTLAGHTGPVVALCLSPHEDELVSLGSDGRLVVWGLMKGSRDLWSQSRIKEKDKMAAAMGNLAPVDVLFLAGKSIIVALRNQSLWRIDGDTGKGVSVAEARGSTYRRRPLFMSPDKRYVARVTPDLGPSYSALIGLAEVERHDIRSNTVERWKIPSATAAAPLISDKWIIGTEDGSVEFRDWGKTLAVKRLAQRKQRVQDVDSSSHLGAALWADSIAELFDAEGKLRSEFPTQPSSESIKLSWNGVFLAVSASGENATVRVFDTLTGKTLFAEQFWASCVAFSSDDRLMAIGSEATHQIQIVSTSSWTVLADWQQDGHLVSGLTISDDSRFLFSSGTEGVVRRWDLAGAISTAESPSTELLKTATARSASLLSGVESAPKMIGGTEATSTVRLSVPVRESERITSLRNLVRSSEGSREDRAKKLLEHELSKCPGPGAPVDDLQLACASADLALAEVQIRDGQPDVGAKSLEKALARSDLIRQRGSASDITTILDVYSDAVALLRSSDESRAEALLTIAVKEREKLIARDPDVSVLKQLSEALNELESLIRQTDDKERIIKFYKDTCAFLETAKLQPPLRDLASQGEALYEFRVGEVLLQQEHFKEASDELAVADRLYGEKVSELVLSGDSLADRARQQWTKVIATRAIALASPYIQSENALKEESNGVHDALDIANRGLEQVKVLAEDNVDNREIDQMKEILDDLIKKLNMLLK